MVIVCIVGLIFNTTVAGVASSRLIWAVARDGVLPFSGWISAVSDNKEPRNAITVMLVVASLLLCTILPSPVAFTSLVSAARSTNYHRLCADLFRPGFPDTWQVQACEVEPGPLLASSNLHCHGLEPLPCSGTVFTT